MGFMDSLKKATGVGLKANEHYDRAYEKGVLLGPEKLADAVGLFETAARKAAESGDVQTQTRAVANARLYGFITSGDVRLLPDLHQAEAHRKAAAEHMAKALSSFHQCGDAALAANSQSLLANFRQRRTCWMCHRELQGAQVHFRTYSAAVSPYAATVVEKTEEA